MSAKRTAKTGTTKIATFNINGVNKRLPNLLAWLAEAQPDVVCLQELKAEQDQFPIAAIREAGYGAVWQGQRNWNEVAILARGADPVLTRHSLPGDPADTQARYLEAAVNGILIAALYLRNGNPRPGPKFDYKLAWFERLIAHAAELHASGLPVVLAGDYNVVPTNEPMDVYSPKSWRRTRCSSRSRVQPTGGCWTKDGPMPSVCCIPTSRSIPSGTTSASTGRRTRACASTTCCSAPHSRIACRQPA